MAIASAPAQTRYRRLSTIPLAGRLPSWLPVAAVLVGAAWGSNQFTPMLLVYHRTLGLGTGTLEAMFGVYALGLIPGLLVAGSLSDASGRRPLAFAAGALSLAATLALIVAGHHLWPLFVGRGLAGFGSGAAFSAGTSWLREVSLPPFGNSSDHGAARRAAVAMTLGFALGPIVAGLLAQWAPAPTVIPYLPHLTLMAIVLLALPAAPETHLNRARGALRRAVPIATGQSFRRRVAPMAPWTFAAPAIAFALLPTVVGAEHHADGIALTATVTMICALAGVLVQPLARQLDARAGAFNGGTIGLLVMTAGLILAAITASTRSTWMLIPSAVVLGTGYGLCLVAGLVEVQRLADPRSLAGLTALFYALTYVGFSAPYLISLAANALTYATLLAIAAGLALFTAALVHRAGSSPGQSSG